MTKQSDMHSQSFQRDTSKLSAFIQESTGENINRVEKSYGNGFVRLCTQEAERRQAQHDIRSVEDIVLEMLRNSRDAQAHHIFVATSKSGTKRHICMIDDGCGIPHSMWNHIFEARVTTKLDTVHMDAWGIHGRGMALYAIRENVHHAYVQDSLINGGTSIVVDVDTDKLPEKRDQSTFPTFMETPDHVLEARGPRNINRCVTEFAFREKSTCEVYIGSDAQIASALYDFGRAITTSAQRVFTSAETTALCKRLALAKDPCSFAEIAKTIGLSLSDRTARRIMDGEGAHVQDCYALVVKQIEDLHRPHPSKADAKSHALHSKHASAEPHVRKTRNQTDISSSPTSADVRNILSHELASHSNSLFSKRNFSKEDLSAFSQDIHRSFHKLAEAYYLSYDVQPTISIKNSKIVISIPLQHDEGEQPC